MPALINTLLQRGVETQRRPGNRFNGFPNDGETVETVSGLARWPITPLKRGVNEKVHTRPMFLK